MVGLMEVDSNKVITKIMDLVSSLVYEKAVLEVLVEEYRTRAETAEQTAAMLAQKVSES